MTALSDSFTPVSAEHGFRYTPLPLKLIMIPNVTERPGPFTSRLVGKIFLERVKTCLRRRKMSKKSLKTVILPK